MAKLKVVVDSLLIHYEQTGSGSKTILMIHGWGDDLQSFDTLTKNLSLDFTVVSVDLPGFGASQAPEGVWGLEEYARFLHNFMQKVKHEKVFAVVAHSNGCAATIIAVAQKQLFPKKIVLLAAAGIRNRQKIRKQVIKLTAKTGKILTFWLPKAKKRNLQRKLYGAIGSDMLVAPHLMETFKKTVAQDIQSEARLVNVPTLLIYGENDIATPPQFGRQFHALIKKSDLIIIENAGHFVHHDQPQKIRKILLEFLK